MEGRLNGNERCRRSIRMDRFTVVNRQKGTFKIRQTSAGMNEVTTEDWQRWGWELSTDISDGTQGLAQIRPHPSPNGNRAAGECNLTFISKQVRRNNGVVPPQENLFCAVVTTSYFLPLALLMTTKRDFIVFCLKVIRNRSVVVPAVV